ncbi:MAG TPA: phosphoserine phosphatase SerB [Acidimicrobiales bacterium]|nr:phosphoserine phosphatase SerB [Acidimicrobiales bacterium]
MIPEPLESTCDEQSVLVRVSGPDRPGITTALLSVLAASGARVLDMEQVVVRDRLNLGVLICVPEGRDLLRELLLYGWDHGVEIDFEVVEGGEPPYEERHSVIVLGRDLPPADLALATAQIADAGSNIERITRLSRYPVMSYEFLVRGGDAEAMRSGLISLAGARPLDVAVQREGLRRRAKRMVVMDVDSTLVSDEVIDLLAEEAGVGAEVAELTARAMRGELDFTGALVRRVELLAGTPEAALERVVERVRLTPGARTFVRTLKRLGFKVAMISGGFDFLTSHLAREMGIDHAFANRLEIRDGRLTGRLEGPVVDRRAKAELLARVAATEGIDTDQVVAVGDGANDLEMLSAAGLGIAFNAKPVVRDAADAALNVPYLDAVLFILGVRREEVEEADRELGRD